MISLDEHLSHCMAEREGMGHEGARRFFLGAIKENPGLLEQSQIRLRYFDSPDGRGVLMRDHISRVHQTILKEVVDRHV